jgi:aminopeptidase N
MIIFCRANDETELFQVTTHEIGHTWFPMVVNTDERRHAWMDEGFNTFINIYSEADWFGRSSSPRTGRIARMLANVDRVPVDTPADQLSGGALGMLQYMKTGTGLQMLREHILGPERFDYAFRTYIRRWAFKSPQPADFFRSMEDASGADLAWFWRGWFLEPAKLDQAIEEVRENDKGATVVFTNLDRMVMPLHFRVTWADDTVENRKLPVEIWHSSNRVMQMLPPGKPIKKVEIDPDQAFPDAARANNVWPRSEEEKKDKK